MTQRPEDKSKKPEPREQSEVPELGVLEPAAMISVRPNDPMYDEGDSVTGQFIAPSLDEIAVPTEAARSIAPGEALQLVRYARRGDTLMISGLTPHGRRLTFEQREDRDGWHVVVAGRRRRPTERELGLVIASITQEMEAAMAPEEGEVRSAYRLAASSDQPGMPIQGLQAYRDLLLDEAAAYIAGQIQRLGVVAIEYQAFKRFAIRHGHRIGAAFVRALGEQLHYLYAGEKMLHVFHKTGKSFRLIVLNRTAAETFELLERFLSVDSKKQIIERVWGQEQRTHFDEVNFHIGVAKASPAERESTYLALAQRLNDDAYRASKLGQLKGHTSLVVAKNDYRTTVYQWLPSSEDELEDLVSQMDDGPGEVAAEMMDFLHELAPADLEGMSVDGDINALMFKAIARDGFWQGTTAMRIAGDRLVSRFLKRQPLPEDEHNYVGGFDLGDEFYGILLANDQLSFAWGDLNSAGSTRVRAGLERLQHAVGWRRRDGGGIVGQFISALGESGSGEPLVQRLRIAAQECYEELSEDPHLVVNDTVDIADFLWTHAGEQVKDGDVVEGARLTLSLRGKQRRVTVLERRSGFMVLLDIEGVEHPAAVSDSAGGGPQVKLRVRHSVISASICVLETSVDELEDILALIREDNNLDEDSEMDIVGFMRHIADILLIEQVKMPAKIELALGGQYESVNFVCCYTLEDVRERHPGLFYEAVHHTLLSGHALDIDRHLRELIGHTMMSSSRPEL